MTEREKPGPLPDLLRRGSQPAPAPGPWRPPADVYRTREGWLVKLELAGVRPSEIEVELSGTRLRVSGLRRDFVIREAQHAHSMEISYNRFERTIEFPEPIDPNAAQTQYQDGMLLISLRGARRG
jgi:HSP20 family protein